MRFWKRKRTLGKNKGNLNKHELWLTIMYRYWFIKCNKCIILMKDVTNRGNWVWGKWQPCIFYAIFLQI